MKKIMLIACVLVAAPILAARAGVTYSPSRYESYSPYHPMRYIDFKYDVIYTAQLKVQEHQLARLDWIYLELKSALKDMGEETKDMSDDITKARFDLDNIQKQLTSLRKLEKINEQNTLMIGLLEGILIASCIGFLVIIVLMKQALDKVLKNK